MDEKLNEVLNEFWQRSHQIMGEIYLEIERDNYFYAEFAGLPEDERKAMSFKTHSAMVRHMRVMQENLERLIYARAAKDKREASESAAGKTGEYSQT